MRLIIRNKHSLSIWNVSDYVKQTQANIIKQETNQYVTLQYIFRKIYFQHLKDHRKVKTHQRHLNDFVLFSQAPARSITDYFHRKSKEYSQQFLKVTLEALGRAYQISKADNSGSLDHLGYKLFYSSEFCNLSEELKFGLRSNKIEFNTVVSVIDSLIKLEYIDYEIINLLILYTNREIVGGDPYQFLTKWEGDREFQIQKKDYYNPKYLDDLKSLRQSQEVTTAIGFVRHIYSEWSKQQSIMQSLKKHNIKQINELVNQMSQTNQNFRKLVQGIINIRRQYFQMTQFSENEEILKNPNITFQLLELQQKLLATKILNIQDIKYPYLIDNKQYEAKRVEEVILRILDIHKLDPIFALIDKTEVEVPQYKQIFKPDPTRISTLINGLTKLAQIDRYLYHVHDGRNLINLKWQKTLVPQSAYKQFPQNVEQQLNVSRIFRRVYKDIYQLIVSHTPRFLQIFEKSNLEDKIQLMAGLCRIGLHQNAVDYLRLINVGLFNEDLNKLDERKFATLIHTFNDIGTFSKDSEIHQAIFDRINSQLQRQLANEINYNIRFSIDLANYLLQNHKDNQKYKIVQNKVLRLLEMKATYFTHQQRQNEDAIQAFKILALQKPQKFGSHPIYLNYLKRLVNDNYKRNPFHSIIREGVYKWSEKQRLLKQPYQYLTMGINNGIQKGVVFSNSDQTSISGQIRNGNTNSFMLRLEKSGVKIYQIATNSLINFNYSLAANNFKLKPIDSLRQKLFNILQFKRQQFDQIYHNIWQKIIQIIRNSKPSIILDRIKFKLIVINKTLVNFNSIQTRQQQYSNKAKYLLQILQLQKLIHLLDDKDIQNIIPLPQPDQFSLNEQLQNYDQTSEIQTSIKVDVQRIKKLLKEAKESFPKLLQSFAKFIGQYSLNIVNINKAYLNGERQSIELVNQKLKDRIDIVAEIINIRYYKDKTFCEYDDWREKIKKKYQHKELQYDKLSNLTKILAHKFCGNVTNKISLLPICRHQDKIERLNLQFKVFSHEDKPDHKPENKVRLSEAQERQIEYIINLQNFKLELKKFYSPKQIVEYIFSFDFINHLNHRDPTRQQLLLSRDSEAYFNYLEQLDEKKYLQSPYVKYIIDKLGKTDRIRQLLEQRKILRINLRMQFKKGLLDGQQYYKKIDAIEDKIIQSLSRLKQKMIDNIDDKLINGELKMISITKQDISQFQDIIKRSFSFSRYYDQDFLVANGDYDKIIHLKRGRAQRNYLKFYLLKKISQNKQISQKQKEILKNWNEDIIKSVNRFVVYPDYTTVKIGQLSYEDLQRLKLKDTQLLTNKNMLLIDLIMQFNQFLDQSFIHSYQRQVKSQYISNNYKISPFLFQKTHTSGFKKLQAETQAAVINQSSKLSNKDLDLVEYFFQIYKKQGFKQRNRYEILCKKFRENINKMNQQIIRNELIEQYIRCLQSQFYKEYNPSLVADIKQKQIDKLWRSVFQQGYASCKTETLEDVTKKLILRLEVVGNNPPPFFGNMLLQLLLHPNIDSSSRESLISSIQLNKFDLKLDSADFQVICALQGKKIRRPNQTKADLAKCSVKLSKILRKKVLSIL